MRKSEEGDLVAQLDSAAENFMAGRDVPGQHPREAVRKFIAWLKPYLHLWTDIELTTLAAKPADSWISMRCRCVLVEQASPTALLGTELLKLVRTSHPIRMLPAILLQLGQGSLDGASTALGEPIRLEDAGGTPWQHASGWQRDPIPAHVGGPTSRYLRYELEFRTQAALERDVAPGLVYEWISNERDLFEGAGHGRLVGQLKKVGLVVGLESVLDVRSRDTTLVAPIPIQLAHVEQSNDRRMVAVAVKTAATVRRNEVHVMLEEPAQLRPHRASPDDLGEVTFQAVEPGDARVSVAYLGKVIDRREVEVHPVQRRSARAIAFDAFERTPSLIAKGLRQEPADSDAFERAVAHLLGLLGFSSLWWGTNRMKSGVPPDQADILAFAPHDGAALVVDATIEPNKDPKVAKVISRAKTLEQTLRRELGDDTFVALPVLAVAAGQHVIPQGWSEQEVEILTGEKLQAALEALRQGEQIESIWATLSTRIRDLFVRPQRRFSVW